MKTTKYPGIAMLGGERITALYGVDDGIVDWQGVGIQHLFYDSYEHDLVHSAVTFLRHGHGAVELGNRRIDGKRHPEHQHPAATDTRAGYLLRTRFTSQENTSIYWVEEVFATDDNRIIFETEVFNESQNPVKLELGGYIILRNPGGGRIEKLAHEAVWQGSQTAIRISLEKAARVDFGVESPTGFVYRTMQKLCLGHGEMLDDLETKNLIGVIISRDVEIPGKSSCVIRWGLTCGTSPDEVRASSRTSWSEEKEKARNYWQSWLALATDTLTLPDKVRQHYEANLIAIKASLLNGFIPADVTGHYFAQGKPSYYARDAMMTARAFILSGHYPEARAIINYLLERPTRQGSGEFYQRYDAQGQPSEGANNNVFHQFDSQGYFLRNILTYYQRTGEWLASLQQLEPYVQILGQFQAATGLIGPEGGINEGVFGPAYIVSTNMIIHGGLQAAAEIAELQGSHILSERWKVWAEAVQRGIRSAWIEEDGRFGYGYVTYAAELVRKYDAPQYFGCLYGYPLDEYMIRNNRFLLNNAAFFGDGIGYTEQEYHHGPWLFNTAACAQFQALREDVAEYRAKINWMIDHSNGYGLMPEAVDALDENRAFINPLVWACAEFVSSIAILWSEDGFQAGRLKIHDQIWKVD